MWQLQFNVYGILFSRTVWIKYKNQWKVWIKDAYWKFLEFPSQSGQKIEFVPLVSFNYHKLKLYLIHKTIVTSKQAAAQIWESSYWIGSSSGEMALEQITNWSLSNVCEQKCSSCCDCNVKCKTQERNTPTHLYSNAVWASFK